MDLNLANRFLQQLDGSASPLFAFRTFSDNKELKDPSLTTNRYGTFPDIQDEFIRLNTKGAGIFFTVNKTDGKGYSTGNIIRVRAVFVDLDGAPLEPVQGFKLKPHIIIESSKARYHAYWIIDEKRPLALPMFEAVQSAIATMFNGDKSVKDLPRVMRLPGFFHKKKEPYQTQLLSTIEEPVNYSADEILDAFGLNKQGKQRTLPVAIAQGQRETRLLSFAGSMRRVGGTEESILAALKIENERCIPPMEISDLVRIAHSVSKYAPTAGDFIRDENGKIYANSQQNIKIALEKLETKVTYDAFANKFYIQREDKKPKHLNDFAINRLWLEGDEVFRFRPTYEFFTKVVLDLAEDKGWFHPVQEYLASLKWDGKDRIETWLTDYGGAADSEYTRAIGRLFLLAAVRRVRTPGCKFDEMLVFESNTQGTDKSSAIKALVPDVEWFSDNLPLNSDSKEVIELTGGKWIIEAAELSGMRKGEVEHLKSFLSRSRDTARLAYERMTTDRPRHFVIFGTTNSTNYLKDSTGNRRFWPIRIKGFDTDRLAKDRDLIWAEAAAREKAGESIRLDPKLWAAAEIQQERRRVEDPWEIRIVQTLSEMNGRILTEDVWKIVGMYDVARRSQADNIRIGDAMRRIGFDRVSIRDGQKVKHGYARGTEEERKDRIIITIEEGEPDAKVIPRMTVADWEKPAPVETGGEA